MLKNAVVLLFLSFLLGSIQAQIIISYPKAKKVDQVDDYYGTKIQDPYRWMENDTTKEVADWVKSENSVTQSYLEKIPYRGLIKDRLTKLWNYERYGVIMHHNSNYFFFKNNGLQNQSVLYVTKDPNNLSKAEVFLDPNKLSNNGTVALGTSGFDKSGKYFGYAINRSGSDWQEIYVMDVEKKERLKDSLRWVKFSDIAFYKDGFFYSRYDEPKGSALSSENEYQKVYYHKIGTTQNQDVLMFEDKNRPKVGFSASVSDDERFLIIYATEGASTGNELYYKDLSKPITQITKIYSGFEFEHGFIDNIGDKFLISTTENAPKKKILIVDPKNPKKTEKVIIPEKEEVLSNIAIVKNQLILTYMKNACHKVYQYNVNGGLEREIQLPDLGTVSGFEGQKMDNELYYSFSSFKYPASIFKYELNTGKSSVIAKPNIDFDPSLYETKQIFYPSADGKQIPMFIVHKKGLKLDGTNPTYLYAYGGFNISLNPSFSTSRLILLENGGVFALPNLRGGGEFGEEWHKAGMLEKKQNVFNDFIYAAQYLIDNKYTSKEKLAIAGGSNGGLLVGACMTQRPDMFKVCFPSVGVLDMLRFHKFTIGHAWVPEYGSSDNAEQFKYLIKYSPLHNIKQYGYPATMIITADHDDRVVPAHSFKFGATLQEKNTSMSPILMYIESNAGHGAGKPTSKTIEEQSDVWSFFFYNTKSTVKY